MWAFFRARAWRHSGREQGRPRQDLRGSERSEGSQGHGHQATSKRKVWGGVAFGLAEDLMPHISWDDKTSQGGNKAGLWCSRTQGRACL